MARTIGIGIQDFGEIIKNNCFYVDKTAFIKEWWENMDSVTLITRPRRFGKTLTMSMTEQFFSVKYAGRGDLFDGLFIWQEEKYRAMQGTYPVISLSFANIKENNYKDTRDKIVQLLAREYARCAFLLEGDCLNGQEKDLFLRKTADMGDVDATLALHQLSEFLYRYYRKKVIILLDEYDTPMQEAYINGFWDGIVAFMRNLFNSTFKTNPWLERGIMTGITRISKETIFSDLNHLEVVTTTSEKYETAFGFTEQEVFNALEAQGLSREREGVKYWYDGFTFGAHTDIYNPWSILNFLDKGKYGTYWANTSSNGLVGKLIQEGSSRIKTSFEALLFGKPISCGIDEQIVYQNLDSSESAVFSLLLASGYLKVLLGEPQPTAGISPLSSTGSLPAYTLALTNLEVQKTFFSMVQGWFSPAESDYNDFLNALLSGDVDAMNAYMNRVALKTFSFFDVGKHPSLSEPERFYHGFVLGLMVDLNDRYLISSNRESGFGRYDVMLEPRFPDKDTAFLLEFKVRNPRKESSLEETVQAALSQMEERQYETAFLEKNIPQSRIRKYGFAFQGKTVLIGEG